MHRRSFLGTAAILPLASAAVKRAPSRTTLDLFVRDWGEGPPVLFLAAWSLPSDMWQYQMLALAKDGLRCVAYDRRGHGRSSDMGGGYDYDTLAGDLAHVLESRDLRDVTLVAMSMAAGEAVRYLARYGSARVARLALVAPAATPAPPPIPPETLEAFRRNVLMRDYAGWLEENRAPFFTPETSREMQEWVKTMMLGTSLQAVYECHKHMTSTDFRADLRAVKVPTLVIHGDKDVSAPVELRGRPTAQMIPNARLVIYEGAPHGIPFTHTERLNRDLLAFVKAR